ncbi:hypothetical protein NON20_25560 (plasmid) [Synechocystis sp. B12]|nr:hypothetical protein NON20_25560 [Synechocystis sp. B12]
MAQQWNEAIANKAYDFCKQKGGLMTEAYMESKDYTVGVCSNAPLDGCDYATKYFIFVQSSADNKVLTLPTWPKTKGKYPNAIYTFESTLNGIKYQIKTTGGTVGYEPSMKFWTSALFEKGAKIVYNNKVNYYYGNIGMGC